MSDMDNQDFSLQLHDLRSKIDFMGDTQRQQIAATNTAIGDLRGDIRALGGKLEGMGALSHTSTENTESIRRIWAGIEKRDQQIQQALENSRRVINLATGAGLVFTLLVGVLVYLYQQDRQSGADGIRNLDERADRIELYLAGDRSQPFRR